MLEDDFKKEVFDWASEVGVKPKEVHIRKMSKKWASCSTKGRVTFSSELLEKPIDFRNEVIAHELLHMRYKNHDKMFKAVLNAHLDKKNNVKIK
ncbi:MAG: M48 family metallopeptidase [Candidatus Micrarchaeota archaeon]|nr:M48 family metallopeptidase [Candidatus Micrarchaeota archaeon]